MKCFDAAFRGATAFNKMPEMLEKEHFMMLPFQIRLIRLNYGV